MLKTDNYALPVSQMLPGVLKEFDLEDVYAALAPKPLLLLNPVNAETRRMDRREAHAVLAGVTAAYEPATASPWAGLSIEVAPFGPTRWPGCFSGSSTLNSLKIAMARIEMIDATRLAALLSASGKQDAWATCLAAFLENGLRAYTDNADAGVEALIVDGKSCSCVNRESAGTAVCSPYLHYVSYSLQEVAKHPYPRGRPGCLRRPRARRPGSLGRLASTGLYRSITGFCPQIPA